MIYDNVIIGAGITGSTIARLLQKKNKNNFLVLEKKDIAGGLCNSVMYNGNPIDTGGGHFLCSKFDDVYDFIFEHIPENKFNKFKRISKIDIHNMLIDYPIEYNINQLDNENFLNYAKSILNNDNRTFSDFSSYCYNNLGKLITENYMIPYNTKLWGVDIDKMDSSWIYKIPKFNIDSLLLSWCNKLKQDIMPSHSYFYYPKNGGYQSVFDSIFNFVKEKVKLSYDIKSIKYIDGHWLINDEIKTKKIISTGYWGSLVKTFNFELEYKELYNNKLTISFPKYNCVENYEDPHWIYLPDIKRQEHRKFNINNYANIDSDFKSYYLETNSKRFIPNKDFLYIETDYAYPIPMNDYKRTIVKLKEQLNNKNFFFIGRWGEHEYYNSDVCIKRCLEESYLYD